MTLLIYENGSFSKEENRSEERICFTKEQIIFFQINPFKNDSMYRKAYR